MFLFFLYISCFASKEKDEIKDESIFNLSVGALRSPINPIPIDYLSIFGRNSSKLLNMQTFSQYLTGEIIYSTLFQINSDSSEQCKLAQTLTLDKKQKERLINIIDDHYQLFFKHPSIKIVSSNVNNGHHTSGIDIGFVNDGKHYISNSFKFTVRKNEGKIALIEVEVFHSDNSKCLEESSTNKISIEDNENINIYYSYQISAESASNDMSYTNKDEQVSPENHQLTIIYTIQNLPIIASIIISLILVYYVYKSVYKENKHADNDLDEYDGCEWKLIHADVCRSPTNPKRLSEFFGWGFQLLFAILLTIFIFSFGTDGSYKNFDELLSTFIKSYIFSSFIGGFFTGKMFKTIGSNNWKMVVLSSSFLLSIILLTPRIFMSIITPSQSSFNFNLLKILMPTGVNFIFYSIGCLIGLKVSGFELSQKINILPRQIPPHSKLFNTIPLSLLSSLFVSLIMLSNYYFLLDFCWTNKSSNSSTSLFYIIASIFSFAILSIDFGIIMVFTQLKKEDYKWWWTAFWSGGMNGVIFFFYSILYYFELFDAFYFKHFLYYSLINMPIFIIVSIVSGAVSLIGCFYFVQFIYNSLKME